MVFVAMFLAIIFLFPATQTRLHALEVHLPQGYVPPHLVETYPYLTVDVGEAGLLRLNGIPTRIEDLAKRIEDHSMTIPVVLVRAEPNAPYGMIAQALGAIAEAGVSPDDICFDPEELAQHRRFERIAFHPATTLPDQDPGETWSTSDIPPSACLQFVPRFDFY